MDALAEPVLMTQWLVLSNGSLRRVRYEEGSSPQVPEGARVVTEEEYLEALTVVDAGRAAYLKQVAEEEGAAQLADFTALTGAGIPEATARRMTRYTGPVPALDEQSA